MKHIGLNIVADQDVNGDHFVRINEDTYYFGADTKLTEDEQILWAIAQHLDWEPAEALNLDSFVDQDFDLL